MNKYVSPRFQAKSNHNVQLKICLKSRKNTFSCTSVSDQISTAPVCGTGGKPSTWFPPGGLVEQSLFLLFVLLFCFFFVSLLSFFIFLFWLLLSLLSTLLSFSLPFFSVFYIY